MRSVLTLGVLCVLGSGLANGLAVSAHARTLHDPRQHRHVRAISHPDPGGAIPPGWYKFPGYPPIPPEENRNLDPSNYGGG